MLKIPKTPPPAMIEKPEIEQKINTKTQKFRSRDSGKSVHNTQSSFGRAKEDKRQFLSQSASGESNAALIGPDNSLGEKK